MAQYITVQPMPHTGEYVGKITEGFGTNFILGFDKIKNSYFLPMWGIRVYFKFVITYAA